MTMQQRKQYVEASIAKACQQVGRDPKSVEVIAVTKYVGIPETAEVLEHGFKHIGENRWQDAKAKWEQLGNQGQWHFIGHLQTNKVKDVIGKFAYIHSLDRISLATELNKAAEKLGIVQRCLIQVNVSGEQSKYGLPPEQLYDFAEQIKSLPHLQIEGLMTMAPFEGEAEDTRPVFGGLRELRDELNKRQIFPYEVRHLSMGMSNDYEVAVEEGATFVRLGSIIVKPAEEE
ncbi:YggS family pyridoxal phosphate-dependent enzyme [Paenibacillus sp. N1-5-1-14]|uniref:YggS family pyridoxal phosphate-dependent enzyme n=1 Tax=Paenibacillus radicibacter TaxID=2972488 RepID=UPI002158EF8F|nr:YggS family pyridoxal phosphate-dependent enzyme [Paenibacillus radicibacter]MCR8641905.1 YggS family pyridoxal phosphate-dependent enzyme [Paenibacillus radicibacter]